MDRDDYSFVESEVRTNKLHCSDCLKKIKVGEEVIFYLDNSGNSPKMKEVYCPICKGKYEQHIDVESDRHPFDLD
jgi:hypothetical protein